MHVIKTDLPPFMFDYKYFLKREVAKKTLDLAVQTFMKYDNNCFLALIWPAAQGHDEEVEKILSKVVYNKKVNLNANGAHNLLAQAYCDETWLGLSTQNYPGILKKLNNCFPIFEPVRVYIFQADSLSKVFTLKDKVRELFNIGKHAIHIADTKEESVRLARLLLNDNAIHFLNYGYPNKFDDFTFKMNAFRGFLKDNQLEPDCYAIDSGMVMAAYGLRKANDIDYLASSTIFETAMIEHHGSEVKYHNIAESEIVDNPKYHFWYDGIKFISIRQLFQMKNNRNEKKDQLDVKLIKPILRNQILFARLKKFKLLLISLIKKIGIYKQVKYLYKKSQNQTK